MPTNARASSSRSGASAGRKSRRIPSPVDDILETDSEVDEFADDFEEDQVDSPDEDASEGELDDEEQEGVAQWEPDDWEDEGDESESEAGDADEEAQMRRLQKGLTSLPFSALMKAQRTLREDYESSSRSQSPEPGPSSTKEQRLAQIKARLAEMQRQKGKASGVVVEHEASEDEQDDRGRRRREAEEVERVKREHKHAPMAMSSKKQVSRMRQVVDVKKVERRDPRFNSLSAGQIDPHLHAQAYDFLPTLAKTELAQLKVAVGVAAKAERTCTWAEKPARTAERERLEADLGKLRTRLERTERDRREREVLAKAKKEEWDKRKEGKGGWYMKKSEQRDLLLKSRFESLEAQGGKSAVKKSIEKKQKKIAGKEKKSRPYFGNSQGGGEGGASGDGPRKRRRAG
ncbi:ribosomal RNA-processing protein 36, partial [Tremellales sp. Uapishka_1]